MLILNLESESLHSTWRVGGLVYQEHTHPSRGTKGVGGCLNPGLHCVSFIIMYNKSEIVIF